MKDQKRLDAAREFVTKAVARFGYHVDPRDFEKAVRKAAEAIPPFTRIAPQEGRA